MVAIYLRLSYSIDFDLDAIECLVLYRLTMFESGMDLLKWPTYILSEHDHWTLACICVGVVLG